MLQSLWYHLGRLLVYAYVHWYLRADIYRGAAIPGGAKIIAVNHPSTTDPAFVTALFGEQITILIKDIVFRVPLFGTSLRMAGHVPVLHGQGRAALDEAVRLVRAGRTVVIFPEGEISPEGAFCKAHTGVARLALATGAPVIPVGISLDSSRLNRVDKIIDGEPDTISWYLHGPYAMTVGHPQRYYGDIENYEQVRGVTDSIMQQIEVLHHHGRSRLALRAARTAAGNAPALFPSPGGNALDVAWKGTWLSFQQSARLIMQTQVFRMAESAVVFLLMFARQFGA